MHRRAEFKESGERPVSLGVLGALTHCGPKQGGNGWLPISRGGKQIASFCLCGAGPRGQVRQCPAGCRVHVRGQGRGTGSFL